jgi:hypothetical protein
MSACLSDRPVRSPGGADAVIVYRSCLASGSSVVACRRVRRLRDRLHRSFTAVRPSAELAVAGALAWTFALIAPAVFIIVGFAKLVDVIELTLIRRERPRPAAALVPSLPDDHVVATRVRLPDGRVHPELGVGPFGVAVVEELPPTASTRQANGRWELRLASGKWIPIENPLDRAARDAERVRRWLGHEDTDHIIKVYATVVTPRSELPRTPTCAVTLPQDLRLAGFAAAPAVAVPGATRADRRDHPGGHRLTGAHATATW